MRIVVCMCVGLLVKSFRRRSSSLQPKKRQSVAEVTVSVPALDVEPGHSCPTHTKMREWESSDGEEPKKSKEDRDQKKKAMKSISRASQSTKETIDQD